MTVRIGVNRESGKSDKVDHPERVAGDNCHTSSALRRDTVGTHLVKVLSPASPNSPLPQTCLHEPHAGALIPQAWIKMAGYQLSPWSACGATRYNSTRKSLSYCPDFIEPKWVRFHRRVSFGLDLRPP